MRKGDIKMNKYEKYDEQIIKLAKEGKRPCEISKIIKIDSRRVIDRLKINNIQYKLKDKKYTRIRSISKKIKKSK